MGMLDASATAGGPVRVMIVDDSAIVRGLMSRALKEDPSITIVASAADGESALIVLKREPIDVVILDIEMPGMDGMTALPKILEAQPQPRVIMASTLTERNAAISLKALSLGASDYVPKPSSRENAEAVSNFYRELISKVKALGRPSGVQFTPTDKSPAAASLQPAPAPKASPMPQTVRYPMSKPKALAIGASTGGPQALMKLFEPLKGKLGDIPIFITQHMPPTFTTILAEHLGQVCEKPSTEGKNGEAVQPGHIYLAPGDYHMVVEKKDGQICLNIHQGPHVNYCRPAVDPMLQSLTAIYGPSLLVVILTGMGQDGLEGAKYAVQAGATIVAQDEATSVVWGMPKAVAEHNICSAVLPISDIAPYIIKSFEA